ncbi:CDP-glycerol glycerophosphotransferase family protein [Cellulosimicrobium terreum]|nr:CDP-glycerol glycerophosphotransferase family protein [Cellulosimicrobium terreum]
MSKARGTSVQRTVRSLGGKVIRRLGLLPGGIPDGLGDDARLLGTTVDQQVVVFFPDTADGLYQLRQWYGPLRALDARRGVLVVASDSRTARAVRTESGLEVVTIAHYATLDDLFSRGAVRLALYVNHNPLNFSMLRFGSMAHVSLLHGDSDKVVSVSNQAKAYDRSFVAGQAAVDRMSTYLHHFDAAARCVLVGRPQLDEAPLVVGRRPDADGRTTVLYAPTWEGAQPSAAYGSVSVLGPALVRSLLGDDRFRVVYRPHPLSGVRLPAYGEADAQIRGLVAEAAENEPATGHRVSTGESLTTAFDAADVLVSDVSAVAMDWLPSRRPLVVTEPGHTGVRTASTRMLETVPRLSPADVDRATELLHAEATDDTGRTEREAMVEYYLGDTTPGAATSRFLQACDATIAWQVESMEEPGPAQRRAVSP